MGNGGNCFYFFFSSGVNSCCISYQHNLTIKHQKEKQMTELEAKTLTSALIAAISAKTEETSKEYVATAERLATRLTLQEINLCKQAAKDALELGGA